MFCLTLYFFFFKFRLYFFVKIIYLHSLKKEGKEKLPFSHFLSLHRQPFKLDPYPQTRGYVMVREYSPGEESFPLV